MHDTRHIRTISKHRRCRAFLLLIHRHDKCIQALLCYLKLMNKGVSLPQPVWERITLPNINLLCERLQLHRWECAAHEVHAAARIILNNLPFALNISAEYFGQMYCPFNSFIRKSHMHKHIVGNRCCCGCCHATSQRLNRVSNFTQRIYFV